MTGNADQHPAFDIAALRMKLLELERLTSSEPGFKRYEQGLIQMHQQAELRKQSCFSQAADLRRQAEATESQGHAFSIIASDLMRQVDGYIEAEKKRIREEGERERRKQEEAALSLLKPSPEPSPPKSEVPATAESIVEVAAPTSKRKRKK